METKTCLCCQQNLLGRTDKKFCDDYCRSTFNNQSNSGINKQLRLINAVLKKNRKILEALYNENKERQKTIIERKIQELGFVFNFHTHIEQFENGQTCYCCYEYGYYPIKQGELTIIKVNGLPLSHDWNRKKT